MDLTMGVNHDTITVIDVLYHWHVPTPFVLVIAVSHLLVFQRVWLQHVIFFVFPHFNSDYLFLWLLVLFEACHSIQSLNFFVFFSHDDVTIVRKKRLVTVRATPFWELWWCRLAHLSISLPSLRSALRSRSTPLNLNIDMTALVDGEILLLVRSYYSADCPRLLLVIARALCLRNACILWSLLAISHKGQCESVSFRWVFKYNFDIY